MISIVYKSLGGYDCCHRSHVYNQFKYNAARFLAEGISVCAILLKIITLLAALFFVWRECQTWMNLPYCEMDICDGR